MWHNPRLLNASATALFALALLLLAGAAGRMLVQSAAFPLKLDNDYQMFEYACHEGNAAIRNYIETSRYERANKK